MNLMLYAEATAATGVLVGVRVWGERLLTQRLFTCMSSKLSCDANLKANSGPCNLSTENFEARSNFFSDSTQKLSRPTSLNIAARARSQVVHEYCSQICNANPYSLSLCTKGKKPSGPWKSSKEGNFVTSDWKRSKSNEAKPFHSPTVLQIGWSDRGV